MLHFVGAGQFKAFNIVKRSPLGLRQRRLDAPVLGVRKQSVEPATKLDERTLRFTISTGCVDRDQDCVAVKGWQLDNFTKNPVVLWSHRADELPIGKVLDIGTDATRLHAAVRFLGAGYGAASDLAETCFRMAQDGYLNATSVGFRPLEWDFTEDEERGANDWFPGIDFHSQELVELSLVSVPANPEALIEAPIMPGDDNQMTAPALIPAPVQVIDYDRARRKRRALAAMLGVF